MEISIIIPCKNEVNTLKTTVDSIMSSKNHLSYEIIIVDDGSIDSSTEFIKSDLNKEKYKNVILLRTNNLGVAGARNYGVKVSKGKYLFFCDAHIKVPDYWLDNLVNTLRDEEAQIVAPCIVNMKDSRSAGYGMTLDDQLSAVWLTNKPNGVTEIPFACGCSFGITKKVFEKVNGFDGFFQVYGSEDFEICLKAWLYGYRVVLNPEVKVQHLFREQHPYQVTNTNIIYNILCLAFSHFGKKRIMNTIEILKSNLYFKSASKEIKNNLDLIIKQRERYFTERVYSDDFFFKKFNIDF